MKGKHALAHGLTGDLALVKSYVYDKHFRDGEPLVELGLPRPFTGGWLQRKHEGQT
jgi:hypothetical protein